MKESDINLYSSMIALHDEKMPKEDSRQTMLSNEETINMLKKIMDFLKRMPNKTFTMYDIYSEITDMPISEVINNWKDYIYSKTASDIRKIIYFLEDCEVIKKEDVYMPDKKQMSHYTYTPSRFNSRLDLLGL